MKDMIYEAWRAKVMARAMRFHWPISASSCLRWSLIRAATPRAASWATTRSPPAAARRYLPGTDVELLRDVPRGRFRHVLFDFDGTISLLREGWQGIMRPVMLEMIAGGESTTPEMEAEVEKMRAARTAQSMRAGREGKLR